MAYVYRHIRLDKNEPFYIGIANDIDGSFSRAYSVTVGRNPLHQNILNKTSVRVDIVLDNLTWEEACEKEKELIKLYGRKDMANGILCNLTDGGEGTINRTYSTLSNKKRSEKLKGRKFSEETLAKMKASRNARTDSQKGCKRSEASKEKNRIAHLGKRHSEETRLKMSETKKGRTPWNKGKRYKYSEETLQKIQSNRSKLNQIL